MRLDSVSKIPITTAVTTATVSLKKTQYIHTETTNTKHDKIYPLHTRLSQRVKYSVNLYTQLNNNSITKHRLTKKFLTKPKSKMADTVSTIQIKTKLVSSK